MAETGIPGKGGTTTQTAQPMFSESTMDQYNDIDTGSGYYRNPYASGYGMGYQDPYASTRFMPASGLMGPTGYSPYRGGKGGFSSQPMYPSYGYSPYGGMSPGKGGYMPLQSDPSQIPPTPPGMLGQPVTSLDDLNSITTPEPEDLLSSGLPPAGSMMDIADADPTQTMQGAAIAADGSNVVDFTPYTGDEFVRIGDQVVSRAELQLSGS